MTGIMIFIKTMRSISGEQVSEMSAGTVRPSIYIWRYCLMRTVRNSFSNVLNVRAGTAR